MPTERDHGAYLTFWPRLVSAALTGNHSIVSTGGTTRVKPVPDVKFCLVFQCETLSIPVMRRVLGDTLLGLGVDDESVYDILLAATEACTNVLTHGGRQARGYAVVTSVGAVGCQVEVADEGAGLAPLVASGRDSPAGAGGTAGGAAARVGPRAGRHAGLRGQRHAGQPPRPRHGRDHAQAHPLDRTNAPLRAAS